MYNLFKFYLDLSFEIECVLNLKLLSQSQSVLPKPMYLYKKNYPQNNSNFDWLAREKKMSKEKNYYPKIKCMFK